MAGLRTAVLFILPALWLAASHAGDPGSPKFDAEISRQESIYHSKDEKVVEGYTVDRSLAVYTQGLATGFDRALASLGPTDRWLDIGAGRGQAILDYYTPEYDLTYPEGRVRRGKKAHAVAISIEDRRTLEWHKAAASLGEKQLQYLINRRLREYSREELGRFQIITDVIGGFSYTDDLSLFVEKVLSFLELNRGFYTVLQDVHWEDGTNRPHYTGAPFLTRITNADGSDLKVCTWLKRIACAEVICEAKAHWQPPVEAYQIRKTCNDVAVPALERVHYEAGTPPERRFRLKN